jgi:hypothetical protein
MPRGVTRNPKLREALKACSHNQAAPNINVMRFRCDEPKAKLRRVFFMRQDKVFSRRMRDGGGCCGRHGIAEMLPRICHAAVRLGWRLDQKTARALLSPWLRCGEMAREQERLFNEANWYAA